MSDYERNKIEYVVMCLFAYADRQGVTVKNALRHLLGRRGIEFLDQHYDAEHTLPIEDTLDALVTVCARNGGVST